MNVVKITTEYITLGQFLKFTAIIYSGAMAKDFLSENEVLVNGEIEQRRGRKLYPGYIVEINKRKYEVQ